jgi:hypothetical protein
MLSSAEAQTCRYAVAASGTSAFVLNGTGNPSITLFRGFTYQFTNSAGSIHPFWIKTIQGPGLVNAYNDGVTGNGATSGFITFSVPTNAPATLFYNCENHSPMKGTFNIVDPPPVAVLDAYLQGNDVIISSVGTNLLRVQVEALEDLVNGTWEPVTIVTNTFAGGTNTTTTSTLLVTNTVYMYRVKACCE